MFLMGAWILFQIILPFFAWTERDATCAHVPGAACWVWRLYVQCDDCTCAGSCISADPNGQKASHEHAHPGI